MLLEVSEILWENMHTPAYARRWRRAGSVVVIFLFLTVTESARARSYISSKQVQKIFQFWLLTFWLLTVPSPSI